jgi:serine protease Do
MEGASMKKWVIGGIALMTLIVGAFIFASPAMAQRDGRRTLQFDGLVLEGPGSTIGVSVRDLGADDASRAKVQPSDGVLVDSVREGTAASKAGLKSGDVIIEFDGERPRSTRHFTRLVRETPPGRTVKMTIVRDGSRRTLDITPEASNRIGGFPDAALRALPRDFPPFNFDGNRNFFFEGAFGSTARLGVVVTPMSDQLAAYFGVKDGVLVSEVQANTPAASAGVKAGDVITSVNGHAISSPQDVVNEVRNVQAGGAIDLKITRDRKELSLKATIPERRRPAASGQPI